MLCDAYGFAPYTDTMGKELQCVKLENESKITEMNTAMEDMNTILVIFSITVVHKKCYSLSNSVITNICKMS